MRHSENQHLKKSRARVSRTAIMGFTLIETLIAMMILSGGIMVLANSWSGNFARIRNARINNTMAALLERKMTETEITYRDRPVNEVPEEESGDFGPKYPGYRWVLNSKDFEMPNLSGALVSREGGADEMLLTMVSTMTEYINQSVKEVSVTVFYRSRGGKEIKNSVTTYFIDYTKELPMPGGIPGPGASN